MFDSHPGLLLAAGTATFVSLTVVICTAAVLIRRRLKRLQENFRLMLVEPVCRLAEFWLTPATAPAMHTRIKLARTVAGAEYALKMALAADAPVGDLPSLCRRLRQEASKMDYALRIGHRASRPSQELRMTIQQANHLSDAAVRIQETALSAIAGVASISSTPLLEDVRIEALASSASLEKLRELSH